MTLTSTPTRRGERLTFPFRMADGRGGEALAGSLRFRICPRCPGVFKRPERFPMYIGFVWGFCMGAQGA
jgi:hypothetical protein